jgi:hypothetical protein
LIISGNKMINKIRLVKKDQGIPISTLYILGSVLTACNSSDSANSSTEGTVARVPLTGAVVKGPLSGALVYADSDGDGEPDGDPIMTASDGSYTLYSTNPNATIIATSGPNTVDTSSGETLTGITLKAPAGSSVVTPATTILEAQPDIKPAQLAVALGIPTTAADGSPIDLMSFNPYAADADPTAALAVEKASQQVMVTIQAVSAAAEGAGMAVEDAFEQAMASVAQVVSVVAETIDVSSAESILEAQGSISSGETEKFDFSDTQVLKDISNVVQEKVIEVAAADTSIEIDEAAFASVLDSAMTAVENVNTKIDTVTDLTSEESMGVFATLTDVASEIKAAAEAEVLEPGSGAELVTFTDASKVDSAADAAALGVLENLEAAKIAFEDIYESFLEEFPVDEDILESVDDNVLDIEDPLEGYDDNTTDDGLITPEDTLTEDDASAIEDLLGEDEFEDGDLENDIEIVSGGGGGGGAAAVVYSEENVTLDYTMISKGTSGSNRTVEFYANISNLKIGKGFNGLSGFTLDVQPMDGWSNSVDALSGNVAFNWTNSLSLTNDVSVTNGVISANNSLTNSNVGKVTYISSQDVSAGSGMLLLGTITFDPKDTVSDISALITSSYLDGTGDLASQTLTMDLY